eukprot:3677501-Amphidinium_carterae.1
MDPDSVGALWSTLLQQADDETRDSSRETLTHTVPHDDEEEESEHEPELVAPSLQGQQGPGGDGPRAWVARLEHACRDKWQRLGQQRRPLKLASQCSGSGCPAIGLRARISVALDVYL